MMFKVVEFFKEIFGIDQAIFWSTLNKGFGFIKAPFSIYFIVTFLTPQDQGLWYTFGSLGALTIFAELGFAAIITQFISHEYAKLSTRDGLIHGEKYHLDRIFGLIRFSIRFYFYVIFLSLLILVTTGYFYFQTEQSVIFIAWICFSFAGGFSLFINLLQSIYQGLDKVKEMQINAFLCAVIGTFFNWGMLILHLKIWALVIGNFIGLIVAFIFLYNTAKKFWHQIYSYKISTKFNFFKETVPLQSKYAISWISGYFIFYLYVPATYKYIGEAQAGQLGLTMSVITVIVSISSNWVSTKIPKFNMLVSNKLLVDLNKLFKKSFIQCIIIQVILSIGFIIGLVLLKQLLPSVSIRFLDLKLILLLLLSQLSITIISSLAVYLRAHKEEPFVWISVLNALLMVFAVFIVLINYKMNAFFWVINIVNWAILLPLSFYIFNRKKRNYIAKYY